MGWSVNECLGGNTGQLVLLCFVCTWAEPYPDLLAIDTCQPAHPIKLPPGMEEVITPLDWRGWDKALREHPDQRFRKFIVGGLKEGSRIGFDYGAMAGGLRSSPANMASALEHPEIVSEYLAKEWSEGRVLGPLDPREFPYIQTSRFGVIPKGVHKQVPAHRGPIIP